MSLPERASARPLRRIALAALALLGLGGEAMRCAAVRGADSVVTWHLRTGTPPRRAASREPVDDSALLVPSIPVALDLRLCFERLDDTGATRYRTTLDSLWNANAVMPVSMRTLLGGNPRTSLSVWGLQRPDGTRIATLTWRYRSAPGALDLHPAATAEERRILSLAVAALAPWPG